MTPMPRETNHAPVPPTIPPDLECSIRYDGYQAVPTGPGWYQFTSLVGASAGATWTVRAGGDVAAKYREVEERFAPPAPCPYCGGAAPVRAVKYGKNWHWVHWGAGCGASWPVDGQAVTCAGGRFEPTPTAFGGRTGD